MAKNVLFIIADQFRADCISGVLESGLKIPNLRALMDEGVTFNRHYTVTTPCGPSRASLLSGLYAMNHRSILNGTPLADHLPTLGLEIRKLGLYPLLFGYTDTSADPTNRHPNDPDLTDYEGTAAGFLEIVRMQGDTNYNWLADLKAKNYEISGGLDDLHLSVSKSGEKPGAINDPALYRAEDSDTAFLTHKTISQLSAREHLDCFSFVSYFRPHPPFVAPAPFNSMYDPDKMPEPNCPSSIDELKVGHPFFDAYFNEPSNQNIFGGFDGNLDTLSELQIAQVRAVYFGLITELDEHIGNLMQMLRDIGKYDDTLIVFTSDHGEMLGDHHMWAKTSFHESALRIPLIIRDPNRRDKAGIQVDAFTESIDLAPTIIDWLGGKPHIGFNGHSLLPILEGNIPGNWREHSFTEIDLGHPINPSRFQRHFDLPFNQCNFAVLRDENYKYIHFNGGLPPLLFDMKNDPNEANNIAQDQANATILLRFATKMIDHRMTHAHHALSRTMLTPQGAKSEE